MTGIKLLGTGSYFPETVVNNEDFTKIVDTSDEWITKRTGIKERRLSKGEPTWYMGVEAGKKAIESAGIAPDDIDLVICTTITGDYYSPSTANIIQGKLGIKNAFSMDISAACAGFVFAVDMAQKYISADDDIKNVLIVSAENLTKLIDYTDRSVCVLFGDAAGAAVFAKGPNPAYSYIKTDGSGADKIYSQSLRPNNAFTTEEDRAKYYDLFPQGDKHYMYMEGNEVYKFATVKMPEAINKVCEKAKVDVSEIKTIIPHQANYRIINTAAKNMNLPLERFQLNIQQYGNTSSACIPTCLDRLFRSGELVPGDKIVTVGFGAGLVYGANVITI